jgi:hypothetical protein
MVTQRAVKRRLEHKAKQKVIAAKKAKALELELQRKEKLIREKRLKALPLSPLPCPLSLSDDGPTGDREDQDDSVPPVCDSDPAVLAEAQARIG